MRLMMMSKLIQIVQDCNLTTENIRHEFTEYNGKKYRITRAVAYPHVNVLTIAKQRIVDKLIKEDMSISEISKIIGVSEATINSY